MENGEMKTCPFCAERIRAEAVKCRYCGSLLTTPDPGTSGYNDGVPWRRVNADKRIAGVCTGVAREFNAPKLVLPLRLFFILTTIFYGVGFIVYILLWMLMPGPVDGVRSGEDAFSPDEPELRSSPAPESARTTDTSSAAFGFILMAVGVLVLLMPLVIRQFGGMPVGFMRPVFYSPFGSGMSLGLLSLIILAGLLILVFGFFKVLRISAGCLFTTLGAIIMVFLVSVFVPFLPKLFLLPLIILAGIFLMFIGGLKLLFGSSSSAGGSQRVYRDSGRRKSAFDKDDDADFEIL